MTFDTNMISKERTAAAPLTSNEKPTAIRPIYSAVDLFAGCGGLGTGLENAGFTTVFVNELDKDAMDTYLRNRGHELGGMRFSDNDELRCHDAHDLKGKRLEKLVGDLRSMREVELHFEQSKLGKLSNLDLVAGGPPCQGYSGIGIRRSYAVDKEALPSNRLYSRMTKIIDRLRPRIFLFENVRGLLTSRWRRDGTRKIFPDVLTEFRKIPGYEVRWSLVYAKDYGVPQNRPRVLLVGIRRDVLQACGFLDKDADEEDAIACRFLPSPKPGSYPDLVDLLGDLVDPMIPGILRSGDFPAGALETTSYPHKPMNELQAAFRTPPIWAPTRAGKLTEQEYSKHKLGIVEKFDHMLMNGGEIPDHSRTKKFSQRVLKSRWGNAEPNMTATSLPDDYVHFSQPRILTVREWARLQMFPDWYEFSGKRTTGGIRRAGNPLEGNFDREVPKYTQIGNAVPVGLAEAVGRHFRKILDEAVGPVLEKADTDVGDVLTALARHEIDAALLVPTETGLKKSIMDATANVRDYLLSSGFHNFETQSQGTENKVVRRAYFVEPDRLVETTVSLYRPQTKSGDPRIWFALLGRYAEPYNLLAIFKHEDDLYVVNASRSEILASLDSAGSPLAYIAAKNRRGEDPVVNELLDALREVSARGFVRTMRPGDTGVGMTLETLLGIAANANKTPDFKGIELKAKRLNRAPTRSTLFSQAPDWTASPVESAWNLLRTFGYHRNGKLRLNCEINAKAPNSLGFMLRVDADQDWLKQDFVEPEEMKRSHVVTWPLEVLRGRLREKHPQTFWVGARSRGRGADEYFHYTQVEHTRAPNVRNFQALLESGVISVDYLMSQRGQKQLVRDHGYLFKIKQKDFPALFPASTLHVLA